MNFTDIFIRRPVLASVISLLILVLGVRAYYVAAGAAISAHRERGRDRHHDLLRRRSRRGRGLHHHAARKRHRPGQRHRLHDLDQPEQHVSTITVYLRLNYDADKALTEINTKIASVLNQLPTGTLQPALTVKIGQTIDAMYLGFNSDTLAPNQITDYLTRVVQPKLQAVPGVQTAELLGQKVFALRAWLDPQKLAAFGLTATDVSQALTANDYISGIGTTKGQMVQVNLTASTGLHSAEEFRNLVVKQSNGAVVRLQGRRQCHARRRRLRIRGRLRRQAGGLYRHPGCAGGQSARRRSHGVHKIWPDIQAQLPRGLDGEIVYDSTEFVNSAIYEVVLQPGRGAGHRHAGRVPVPRLGALVAHTDRRHSAVAGRHAHHPAGARLFDQSAHACWRWCSPSASSSTTPSSSSKTSTAILRKAWRRFRPPSPRRASSAGPIIAMTVVLGAVYVPIGFQGGLTGALFAEFAFALVGAVTVSGVVALTLSPMLCSRLLKAPDPAAPRLGRRS